jgi:hypothetical protein
MPESKSQGVPASPVILGAEAPDRPGGDAQRSVPCDKGCANCFSPATCMSRAIAPSAADQGA